MAVPARRHLSGDEKAGCLVAVITVIVAVGLLVAIPYIYGTLYRLVALSAALTLLAMAGYFVACVIRHDRLARLMRLCIVVGCGSAVILTLMSLISWL